MKNILKVRVDRHRSVQNASNVLLNDFVVWRENGIRSLLNDAGFAESVRVEGTEEDLGASECAVHHRAAEPVLQLHRLKHLDAKTLHAVMLAITTVVIHRVNDLLPPLVAAQLPIHEVLAVTLIDDGMADLAIELLVEDVGHQHDL
ncbi:MAG: hypothetical protein ACK55Z_09630 [bacterium]